MGGRACTTRRTTATRTASGPSSRRPSPRRCRNPGWPSSSPRRHRRLAAALPMVLLANLFSAVEMQGVRALRERAGRRRGDAAAPRGEAGLAALRPRPARERRHRVSLQWCLRVGIPPPPLMSNDDAFLCEKKEKKKSRLLRKLCHVFDLSARSCRFPGSTPLHLAARGGNLDCVRQLLSWGADRLQRDSVG